MSKDRRLGKGLAALLGQPVEGDDEGPATIAFDASAASASQPSDAAVPRRSAPRPAFIKSEASATILTDDADSSATDPARSLRIPVNEIDANPFQPRREFNKSELAAMAESLKEHDMLQPVLVRRVGSRYQLISGERRLRAAIEAGWTSVPASVRVADDRLAAELAIVENLQRKDLNAIEKALSFKRYLDEHRCHQEDLAKRLKIDRSTIANLVRLLDLPAPIQSAVASGAVTAGHARALLPLDEKQQLAFNRRIQDEGLSVRDVERLVQEQVQAEDGGPSLNDAAAKPASRKTKSEQIAALEQQLRALLGCRIEIRQSSKGRGRVVIHFAGHDDFERLREHLVGEAKQQRVA